MGLIAGLPVHSPSHLCSLHGALEINVTWKKKEKKGILRWLYKLKYSYRVLGGFAGHQPSTSPIVSFTNKAKKI